MAWIAPSLLAADVTRLAAALEVTKAAGAGMVHLDVMDGHFGPEITLGQPVVASLRKATDLLLDVHLLVERPERYVADFAKAGADWLSVQAEATAHLHRTLGLMRRHGVKTGVALNPGTSLALVEESLPALDFLTILTAEPGAGDQALLSTGAAKVRAAARRREELGLDFMIQVEGSLGRENIEELVLAGADILVVGADIFTHNEPKTHLAELIRLAGGAGRVARA